MVDWPDVAAGLEHQERPVCHTSDTDAVAEGLEGDALRNERAQRRSCFRVDDLAVVHPVGQRAIFHHVLGKEMKRLLPVRVHTSERRPTPVSHMWGTLLYWLHRTVHFEKG